MNMSDMLPSRFLKQSDVENEGVATIDKLTLINVALPDSPPEMKWCAKFAEFERPLVLNGTNIRLLGQFFGNQTAKWMGQQVVIYVDPSITFGGKLVGGIRLRNATKKPAPRISPTAQDKINKDLSDLGDDNPM